jgi:hypothetical protein
MNTFVSIAPTSFIIEYYPDLEFEVVISAEGNLAEVAGALKQAIRGHLRRQLFENDIDLDKYCLCWYRDEQRVNLLNSTFHSLLTVPYTYGYFDLSRLRL